MLVFLLEEEEYETEDEYLIDDEEESSDEETTDEEGEYEGEVSDPYIPEEYNTPVPVIEDESYVLISYNDIFGAPVLRKGVLRAGSTQTVRLSGVTNLIRRDDYSLGDSLGISSNYRPYFVLDVPIYGVVSNGSTYAIQGYRGDSSMYPVFGYYYFNGSLNKFGLDDVRITDVPSDATSITIPIHGYDGFQLYKYITGYPPGSLISDSATRTLAASDCTINVTFDVSNGVATYNGKSVDCSTCYFYGETPATPTPTPTPTPTATPTATPTVTPSATPEGGVVADLTTIETGLQQLLGLTSVLVFMVIFTCIASAFSSWRRSVR